MQNSREDRGNGRLVDDSKRGTNVVMIHRLVSRTRRGCMARLLDV
jgi:hypothetical protein